MDNAATSGFKPPEVINAVANTLRFVSANPGRSGHTLANRGAMLVERTRAKVAEFVGHDQPSRVIFVANCSDALNLATLGVLSARGGHVVTTMLEHNSVLRPLHALSAAGRISLSILAPDGRDGTVSPQAFAAANRPDTVMWICTHISNVTGAVLDIAAIGQAARRAGVLMTVDAAQSAGYAPLDMRSMCIDLLALAPHKGLHGIAGLGVLVVGERAQPSPLRFGGTGTESNSLTQPAELPEGLEVGTLPLPAIGGLCAALGWLQRDAKSRRERMSALQLELTSRLCALGSVTLFSYPNPSGIVTISLAGLDSAQVCNILDEQYGVCVRGGLHCAPLIHRHLGSWERGLVRLSIGCDTTFAQVAFVAEAIAEIGT